MENLTHSEFQKYKEVQFWLELKIMDVLGCFLKIFKLNYQKRPEAKVDLKIMI